MTGQWYLNGSDLYANYGVLITKGSYNDMMSPPTPRRRMEYEYSDENGVRVDKTTPLSYEPKRYKIKIVIVANSFSQFWSRYDKFFGAIDKANTFSLRVDSIGLILNLYYEGAKNTDKLVRLKNGRVASAFEVSVFEPNPAVRETLSKIYFEEYFNDQNGTGGNDGAWGGNISTQSYSSLLLDTLNTYIGYKCIRVGTASSMGRVTTKALGLNGDAVLRVKIGIWETQSEQTEVRIRILNGGTLSGSDTLLVSGIKGSFKQIEIPIKNGQSSSRISIEGKNINTSRFFLDEIIISKT